jgi:hypothetical protein
MYLSIGHGRGTLLRTLPLPLDPQDNEEMARLLRWWSVAACPCSSATSPTPLQTGRAVQMMRVTVAQRTDGPSCTSCGARRSPKSRVGRRGRRSIGGGRTREMGGFLLGAP